MEQFDKKRKKKGKKKERRKKDKRQSAKTISKDNQQLAVPRIGSGIC